jgi:hypothetical protein
MTQDAFFGPSKRAIFIRPMNGHNMGKIVELIERFVEMDNADVGSFVPFNGTQWVKGKKCHRTWIVESMGDPIVYLRNGELTHLMIGPVPEYYLAPLDDVDQEESLWIADVASKEQEHDNQATESAN